MKKTYLILAVVIFTLTSCEILKEIEYIKLSAPQVTANAKELVRITNDVVGEYQPCLSPNEKNYFMQ